MRKKWGTLLAFRGVTCQRQLWPVQAISWSSGQKDPGRDLSIRAAYLVLEGRAVTLGECVVFSGVTGAVNILLVVIVVVDAGQTQNWIPENQRVRDSG